MVPSEEDNQANKIAYLESITDGFSVIPDLKWMIYFIQNLIIFKQRTFNTDFSNLLLAESNQSNFKNSNQYKIATANSIQSLTIPLMKGSKDETWKNKRISYDHNWIKEHKNALQTAYGKSPFFEYYDYKLYSAFDSKPEYLWELNQKIMNMMLPYLGFNLSELNNIHSISTHTDATSINFKQNAQKNTHSNPKIQVNPNQENSTLESSTQPFPASIFIPEYTQVFNVKFGFQSHVSILDLFFNLGPLSNEYFKNSNFVASNY